MAVVLGEQNLRVAQVLVGVEVAAADAARQHAVVPLELRESVRGVAHGKLVQHTGVAPGHPVTE